MKAIIVDISRCNGCYDCQFACKDEHCGNDWSPIAKPQPMTGQFWCKVDQKERGRVPVVAVDYTPTFCGHCDNAACMAAAKGGAVYRREDGLVVIDPEKARGQKQIVDACPQHMVFWNEELQLPQKCTGCAHLLDDGWTEPRCVDACFTGAQRYGDESEFADEIAKAQQLPGSEGLGMHVYYLNKRGPRWIAGEVADRSANEVVIGAKVTIADAAGATVATLSTDEFGDFRYNDAKPTNYHVTIEAEGYGPVQLEADCNERDEVFDDIVVKAN